MCNLNPFLKKKGIKMTFFFFNYCKTCKRIWALLILGFEMSKYKISFQINLEYCGSKFSKLTSSCDVKSIFSNLLILNPQIQTSSYKVMYLT